MRLSALSLAALFLISVILAYGRARDAALLRADPNTLPAHAAQMQYALRDGTPLYRANCSVCHGERGDGNSSHGIPDLTDSDWLYGEGTVGDIERTITYGIRSKNPKGWNLAAMPAYAQEHPSTTDLGIPPLQPDDIRDLVEFLHYAQKSTAEPGAAVRGAAIFAARGGCWDCHGADARGDPAIGAPNLVDAVTLFGDGSRQALFDSIAYGRHGVCPAWIGRLSASDIRKISMVVYSFSLRRTDHSTKDR